jgi:heme oxygenase
VHDPALARTAALERDLVYHRGHSWARDGALRPAASPALQAYLAQLAADAADPHRLLCHHFLQYNAVLSGGLYQRRMLNKKFKQPESNRDGVARVISDCHFRKTAPEYDRKPGIKWLSCTAK